MDFYVSYGLSYSLILKERSHAIAWKTHSGIVFSLFNSNSVCSKALRSINAAMRTWGFALIEERIFRLGDIGMTNMPFYVVVISSPIGCQDTMWEQSVPRLKTRWTTTLDEQLTAGWQGPTLLWSWHFLLSRYRWVVLLTLIRQWFILRPMGSGQCNHDCFVKSLVEDSVLLDYSDRCGWVNRNKFWGQRQDALLSLGHLG